MLDKMKDKYGLDSTWIAGYADPKVIAEDSLLDLRTGIILPEVTDFKPNSRMVILMHATTAISVKKITLPGVISCRKESV